MWRRIALLVGIPLMAISARADVLDFLKASSTQDGDFSGSLVGFVGNQNGVPQMGASVLLYNSNAILARRAVTNEKGAFGFDQLAPGLYSVRVSMASFVPALKNNVRVQPGMRSFLSIDLASVLSSIELIYSAPGSQPLMSDDWKRY